MTDEFVIALALDWPVYAPLYIAQEAGYFSTTSVVFGKFRRQAPPPESTPDGLPTFRDPTFLHQQVDAMWGALRHNPPLLTVCDPMHGLIHNAWPGTEDKVQLVGALIIKPACWFFNCAHNVVEFSERLRDKVMRRVRTHPPGMSADTLARWALMKHGHFTASELNELLTSVAPGEELRAFETASNDYTTCGAVSVDYITMRRLADAHRSQLGMSDCSEVLKQYLMTGILVRERELREAADHVARVLAGVELALGLLTSDFETAFALLRQHYARRAHQPASDALLEREYLEPLSTVHVSFEDVRHMLRHFLEQRYYPRSVVPDRMSERLASTWEVYREAQRDVLAQRQWDHLDAGTLQVVRLARVPRRRGGYSDVCRYLDVCRYPDVCWYLARMRVSPLAHQDTKRIVSWIQGLKGELTASQFRVVGTFLVADDRTRSELRECVERVRLAARNVPTAGTPAVFGVFGPPGSGKDRFVMDVLEDCIRAGLLASPVHLNLFDHKQLDSAQLRRHVTTSLQGRSTSGANTVIPVFVNEANKHPLGDDVFGAFCPLILVDRQSVEKDGLSADSARRVIWFFAGTISGTAHAVRSRIAAANGGRDFVSRLGEENIITLPPLAGPVEQLLRFLSVSCVDQDGHLRADRPKYVTAQLLLCLATWAIRDSRDPNRIMDSARGSLARGGGNRLRVEDVLSHEQIAEFYNLYDHWCRQLGDTDVHLVWDVP